MKGRRKLVRVLQDPMHWVHKRWQGYKRYLKHLSPFWEASTETPFHSSFLRNPYLEFAQVGAETHSDVLYKQIRGRGTRLCAGKRSFLILDFVGNSERFNEGYVPPKEPLDPVLGASYHGQGGTFVPTVVATDSWIWREWLDVEPGKEAVPGGVSATTAFLSSECFL